MQVRYVSLKLLFSAVAVASLAACGGDGDGGGVTGQGSLRLAVTDAPACGYDAVFVTVTGVRVHQSGSADESAAGWHELSLDAPRRIDLLSLTNGVLEELGQLPLPAGNYQQLRLLLAPNGGNSPLANAVVPAGGSAVAFRTPSGQQSGLKMKADIDIAANQMADFVIDFDACKSVVAAGNSGQYLLKPVLSVVPRLISGVSGYLDGALYSAGALVSLQQNGQVVRATVPDASGRFVLQPAPTGTYSVVFTAPGHTTVVVNGVPVTADTVTPVSVAGAVIGLPTSPTATANGAAPVNTLVRVLQPLGAGPTIEVAGRYVNADTGAYSFNLPTNAPLVASYVAPPAALNFTPDPTAAGRYMLHAALEGFIDKSVTLPLLTAGNVATTPITFP